MDILELCNSNEDPVGYFTEGHHGPQEFYDAVIAWLVENLGIDTKEAMESVGYPCKTYYQMTPTEDEYDGSYIFDPEGKDKEGYEPAMWIRSEY